MKKLSLFLIFTAFTYPAWAVVPIPSQLSPADQISVLQILGFSTAYKTVDVPHPLGGYSGLEIGVSVETLPTADLAKLGTGSTVSQSAIYPKLNIGKGIYDTIDILFSFVPYNEGLGLSNFAGAVRWTFFQGTYSPFNLSTVVSGSGTNFNNQFFSQTTQGDLVVGLNLSPMSFNFGVGAVYGQGQIVSNLNANSLGSDQAASQFHFSGGVSFNFKKFFASVQLDQYRQSVLTSQLGVRL